MSKNLVCKLESARHSSKRVEKINDASKDAQRVAEPINKKKNLRQTTYC